MYGELLPLGGGDPIPLLKTSLIVGRRESADIVLRFPNVSGQHCELALADGGDFHRIGADRDRRERTVTRVDDELPVCLRKTGQVDGGGVTSLDVRREPNNGAQG